MLAGLGGRCLIGGFCRYAEAHGVRHVGMLHRKIERNRRECQGINRKKRWK